MDHAVSDKALDIIFRSARTQNKWQDKPVSPALLMAVYDLMRMGPTSANISPARIVFVVSKEAKERLKPYLSEGNRAKTMSAPGAKDWFADPKFAEVAAFRNGTLQGAYFIMAARALGLDCGPMSGFDNAGVDREFFPEGTIKSNFLCSVGYGDPSAVFPRSPRLSFDEACKIL